MILRAGIKFSMYLTFAFFMGLSSMSFAQPTGELIAAPNTLVVDGWRMIMPSVNVDRATGKTWVRYDLPGGSYQSYPLGPGEPITEKWFKPGVEGLNTTPGGYSIEATEEIKKWYMNGGTGHYYFENGNWNLVSEQPQPPAPEQDTSGNSATDAYTGASSRGSGTSGSAGSNPMQSLVARLNEAKKACHGVARPDPKDCANYDRLYKEYVNMTTNQ